MSKAYNDNATKPDPIIPGTTALAIAGTIDRLKAMAAEAQDHLYLSDGPPQPDHVLLDLCADILHLMKQTAELRGRREKASRNCDSSPDAIIEWRAADDRILNEARTIEGQISSLMSRAKKHPAKTAAGIYAKALVCRHSVTGAAVMAMTLANDLIAQPALRASIWSEEKRS